LIIKIGFFAKISYGMIVNAIFCRTPI